MPGRKRTCLALAMHEALLGGTVWQHQEFLLNQVVGDLAEDLPARTEQGFERILHAPHDDVTVGHGLVGRGIMVRPVLSAQRFVDPLPGFLAAVLRQPSRGCAGAVTCAPSIRMGSNQASSTGMY